jgi:hypothetical protein
VITWVRQLLALSPLQLHWIVMIKGALLTAIITCSIALSAQGSNRAGITFPVGGASEDLARVISWLPADTETITVARGPFMLAASTVEENERKDRAISEKELARSFEELPLALLQFRNGLLAKDLEGKTINLALEGARHFRPPADLGEMPYEGCAIVVFADSLRNEISSFTKDNRRSALKVERIEDQDVLVFQEKLERDTWTTFVAFPNEHMIFAASDRSYLAEVLARFRGRIGQRALPSDLPEWKYVNTGARFWGVRHYDKNQAQTDPSSPYDGRKSANVPDEQAIGLTFVFDPQGGKLATLTYLSGNSKIGQKPSDSPLRMAESSEAKGLDIKYRELSPGVVQGTYSLERFQALQFFLFALEATLGHAIYL